MEKEKHLREKLEKEIAESRKVTSTEMGNGILT